MTHLTQTQICQTIDGTADYATQAAATSHLAVCQRCRGEVELQRSMMRAARRIPPPQVSEQFTKRVMARVLPKNQSPLAAWILNNMGNVFAMMVVLAVLTFVMTNPTPLVGTTDSSPGQAWMDEMSRGMENGYAKITSFLQRNSQAADHASRTGGSGETGNKLVLIAVSLAALGLADKFFLSRSRTRPRA